MKNERVGERAGTSTFDASEWGDLRRTAELMGEVRVQ